MLSASTCLLAIFLVIPLKETFGKPLLDNFSDSDEDQSAEEPKTDV